MHFEIDRAVVMKSVFNRQAFIVGRTERSVLAQSTDAAFSHGAALAMRTFPHLLPSLHSATSLMQAIRMHGARTATIAGEIGLELGLSSRQIDKLVAAATVHDVGKALVSPPTLASPDTLSAQAVATMREHARFGHQLIVESFTTDAMTTKAVGEVALYHHERWDGLGYPYGLRGKEIPLLARIVAVADVFDALVSARSYKSAWTTERAVAEIVSCRGTQFDPDCVDAFLQRADAIALIGS